MVFPKSLILPSEMTSFCLVNFAIATVEFASFLTGLDLNILQVTSSKTLTRYNINIYHIIESYCKFMQLTFQFTHLWKQGCEKKCSFLRARTTHRTTHTHRYNIYIYIFNLFTYIYIYYCCCCCSSTRRSRCLFIPGNHWLCDWLCGHQTAKDSCCLTCTCHQINVATRCRI